MEINFNDHNFTQANVRDVINFVTFITRYRKSKSITALKYQIQENPAHENMVRVVIMFQEAVRSCKGFFRW